MGSVTPYETNSGKRYRVRYRLPDHSQTDKRGFKTKRDAELFLASVEVMKARGEFVSASQSKITLGEWAELWLANQVQLKPSTRLGYETIVRAAILPWWAKVSLADLTHAGIQNWLTEVAATAAPSTTRSYHRVMSMMLKYAIRDGRLSRNPADGVKLPRIVKGKHPYLSHAQVQHLAHLAGRDGDVVPPRSVASWSTARPRTTAAAASRSRRSSSACSLSTARASAPASSSSLLRKAAHSATATGAAAASSRQWCSCSTPTRSSSG